MNYQQQYTSFLSTLHQDTRPWITNHDIPKDGSHIYLMCGRRCQSQQYWEGNVQYDVGRHEDYTKHWWYLSSQIPGEITSEFGNCDEIIGWKFVEDKECLK